MRTLITLIALTLFALPAFADVAVDPCEGLNEGDACTTDGGAAGTCDENGNCAAGAANNTNGATNNDTNTATNNDTTVGGNNETTAANNETGGTPTETTGGDKEEKKGCSTVGASGLLPSLLVFALVAIRRRR